jgi:hypothetical protein
MDQDRPIKRIGAGLVKVAIFEIAERPWGWLSTNATEADDRVFVGSREWRALQSGKPLNARNGQSNAKQSALQSRYRQR